MYDSIRVFQCSPVDTSQSLDNSGKRLSHANKYCMRHLLIINSDDVMFDALITMKVPRGGLTFGRT